MTWGNVSMWKCSLANACRLQMHQSVCGFENLLSSSKADLERTNEISVNCRSSFGCQYGAVFICVLQDTARWCPDPPLLIAAVKHGGDAASQGCCCCWCWCALHIPHNNHMHIHHVTVTLAGLLTAPRRVLLCLNVIPVLPYGCRHHHGR